ncbi:hypothetical protein O7621_15830 [Solwaraspora sp. WMMD937]|uniref:hypothetical protein n=1 Tax=Solwaraspora sp. WMMD937 TaxID=3016090 RepID=UPI00249B7F9C|nr:hypothetical protein [Solwaraspora sp. WMMD937]WFE19421.1 hypothetical protein O7621_15830 [Solwaraspora sp. WMMD937]
MIPQLVTVRWRQGDGRRRRLWIPVLPVLLMLSPLLAIALAGGLVACLVYRISPTGALRAAGCLLWALPGARVELAQGRTALLVIVR